MSPRAARLLAWSLFAIFVAIVMGTVVLAASSRGGDGAFILLAFGYPLVGALVASRQPHNSVGWILLVIGLALALGELCDTNIRSASAPLFALSAWASQWLWHIWLGLAGVFLPLVFPTGRLISRRWRPVLWFCIAALLAQALGAAFQPGPLEIESPRSLENPLGIEAAGLVSDAGTVLAVVAYLLAAASLVVRFRRARGTERQQLKWFAYVGLFAVVGLVLATSSVLFGTEEAGQAPGWAKVVGPVGWFTALTAITIGVPVATGMAILRHRLYDIDVVIRRTLVYATLTATLLASYVGIVLLLQLLLSPGSDLAIAASTLAVAALFRPLRARIQELVDRRFFRSRYDAAVTLAGFGTRLRDEVELQAVSADLRAVVAATMQPAHVSLWLREGHR